MRVMEFRNTALWISSALVMTFCLVISRSEVVFYLPLVLIETTSWIIIYAWSHTLPLFRREIGHFCFTATILTVLWFCLGIITSSQNQPQLNEVLSLLFAQMFAVALMSALAWAVLKVGYGCVYLVDKLFHLFLR